MLLMAILMFCSGVQYYKASPDQQGYGIIDHYSMANIDYSQPVCVQQYVALNETRMISCNLGSNGTAMKSIYSTGIVPSYSKESSLSECLNIQDNYVTDGVSDCSAHYLDNKTLTEFFQ